MIIKNLALIFPQCSTVVQSPSPYFDDCPEVLNLLSKLRKRDKCEACRAFYRVFATNLFNSMLQEHECMIQSTIYFQNYFEMVFTWRENANFLQYIYRGYVGETGAK